MKGAAVQTMYKREAVPLALERYTYEPTLLVIRTKDGDLAYPEHGYIGVNAEAAFHVYGHTAKWNRRVAK